MRMILVSFGAFLISASTLADPIPCDLMSFGFKTFLENAERQLFDVAAFCKKNPEACEKDFLKNLPKLIVNSKEDNKVDSASACSETVDYTIVDGRACKGRMSARIADEIAAVGSVECYTPTLKHLTSFYEMDFKKNDNLITPTGFWVVHGLPAKNSNDESTTLKKGCRKIGMFWICQ